MVTNLNHRPLIYYNIDQNYAIDQHSMLAVLMPSTNFKLDLPHNIDLKLDIREVDRHLTKPLQL